MKIAVVAPTYLPARRANTIQVMKMCQAFQDLGHEIHLAVPTEHADPALEAYALVPSWDELRNQYGLHCSFPIEWLPSQPKLRRYDFGWRSIRWARRIQADLIYTRLPQTAALASLLGFPTIFEVHDYPGGKAGPRMLRLFLVGAGARRLVVITHALSDDIQRDFKIPSRAQFLLVAQDGVDLIRYENLPEPITARKQLSVADHPDRWPERFTAGYSGHLYPGRGTGLLLKMANLEPEINFLLVGGEQADVDRLRNQAGQEGLTNLIFTGFVPNADLPYYQAACETLLMPYQNRVAASSGGNIAPYLSPMKLFEYLACGRAILSSDLPVLREVLNENNAVLLPPDDPQAWVQTLRTLKNEPSRANKLAAQARLDAQKYTWTARATRILDGL